MIRVVINARSLVGPVRGVVALAGVVVASSCVNLHEVEEGRVYRVSQPDSQQLRSWIWRYGIETVVRLRGGDPGRSGFDDSFEPTLDAGIDFVQLPMSANRFPERHELLALCELFERARYPILLHCRAGADRTGLASAVYTLHATGDLERARSQLSLRYLHTGWPSTHCLDEVLDLYEPWQEQMTFAEWVRRGYTRPHHDTVTEEYLERQRQRLAAASPAP